MNKRAIGVVLAVISSASLSAVCFADFYVIPTAKKNYAPVAKTGQSTCFNTEGDVIDCAGTGQDGDVRAGVAPPSPRFVDSGDGTVKDSVTDLIWVKNLASCNVGNWQHNLDYCNALSSGTCGLTDGSKAGDWRLANRNELLTLLDLSQYAPALPTGHLFNVSESTNFISSTTSVSNTTTAFIVGLYFGTAGTGMKTGSWEGACVRGGQ